MPDGLLRIQGQPGVHVADVGEYLGRLDLMRQPDEDSERAAEHVLR